MAAKWDHEGGREVPLLNGAEFDCVSNAGTKATPVLSADILGDWREEVVWRSRDGKELRIFTSTIPTEHRRTPATTSRRIRASSLATA